MKKILFLLFSLFVIMACNDEIPEERVPMRSGRSILAYLISNNNGGSLDKHLKQNLVDMYTGLASCEDSCTLLVYYRPDDIDRDGLDGPSILQFDTDGKGNINKRKSLEQDLLNASNVIKEAVVSTFTEDEHNATDPVVMERILRKMIELSPSKCYGLIFGSHGTSWMPSSKTKGRSFGDDAGYSIDIPEMADCIGNVFGGKKLDFILFDACMMGTAEVCYEFKDVTDYLIGSVVETHVLGYPYSIILPKLYDNNGIDYEDICKDYTEFSKKNSLWALCAAIDCRKIDLLASWINNNLPKYKEGLLSFDKDDVQQYGWSDFKYFSFDIIDFFKNINREEVDGDTPGEVPDDLEDIINEVVVAKSGLFGKGNEILGRFVVEEDKYCGLGMYIPDVVVNDKWNSFYRSSISWYNAAGWGNLSLD